MEQISETKKESNHSIIIERLNKNIDKLNRNEKIKEKTKEKISDVFSENNWIILSWINNEYILEQIEEFEKNNEYYSQWHAAKIFLIEVFFWWNKKKLLIIKDLLKKNANSNEKILNEYSQYIKSHQILSNAWNDLVCIPKTYWLLNDHKWNIVLILDFIPWMTLFGFKISIVLPILYDVLKKDLWDINIFNYLWSKELYCNLKTDKEIKTALLKILDIFYFHNRWDFFQTYLKFYEKYRVSDAYKWTWSELQMAKIYDSLKDSHDLWLLSKKNITCIQDSLIENISILQKNNIYHNDMNQRNIILWDDGKIYIIDFDKSTNNPKQNKSNIDPKYIPVHKWISLDWDFKIIGAFSALEKKSVE